MVGVIQDYVKVPLSRLMTIRSDGSVRVTTEYANMTATQLYMIWPITLVKLQRNKFRIVPDEMGFNNTSKLSLDTITAAAIAAGFIRSPGFVLCSGISKSYKSIAVKS